MQDRHVGQGILVEYHQHMRRRGLSKATMDVYLVILRGFVASADPATRTTASIEGWLDDRNLGLKARHTYVSALVGFYRFLRANGHIEDDPAASVIRPRVPRRYPRPVSDEDLLKALATAPARMRCWLTLAAYAGLRCKEIAGLDVKDIRLDRDPPVLHLSETKGSKDRIIPIADEVMSAFEAYTLPLIGPAFPALDVTGRRTRKPLKPHSVSSQISLYLHGIGIAATAHQLRHWFGTELYRRTRNPLLVRDLMGHSDLATTSGYMALTPSIESVEAVRTLGQNTTQV